MQLGDVGEDADEILLAGLENTLPVVDDVRLDLGGLVFLVVGQAAMVNAGVNGVTGIVWYSRNTVWVAYVCPDELHGRVEDRFPQILLNASLIAVVKIVHYHRAVEFRQFRPYVIHRLPPVARRDVTR